MRKTTLAASFAAAALIPSFALAQQTCEQQRNSRAVGTAAGAGLGALAGGAVAGRDDRAAGAVIGGIAGAIIGNQVTRGAARDCTQAYGYYDQNNMWHATDVSRDNARGYYDREGRWVDGAPNGYYDAQGRWVAVSGSASTAGYYDRNNHWVPTSAPGYYDSTGQWAPTVSGYYSNGRWIAGPTVGRYDSSGRWISGQPAGRRDSSGAWIADPQPGYYDATGRWRSGAVSGFYDTQGRWIATSATYGTPSGYGAVPYGKPNPSNYGGAMDDRQDFASRVTRLERRITRGLEEGTISRRQGAQALRQLSLIRREEASLPHSAGRLSPRNEARMQARLQTLQTSVRLARQDGERAY